MRPADRGPELVFPLEGPAAAQASLGRQSVLLRVDDRGHARYSVVRILSINDVHESKPASLGGRPRQCFCGGSLDDEPAEPKMPGRATIVQDSRRQNLLLWAVERVDDAQRAEWMVHQTPVECSRWTGLLCLTAETGGSAGLGRRSSFNPGFVSCPSKILCVKRMCTSYIAKSL